MTSYVGHDDVRSAHRSAISKAELAKVNVLRVFLLAEIPAKEKFIKQEAIENEHQHFNDIVQGLYAYLSKLCQVLIIKSLQFHRKFHRSIPQFAIQTCDGTPLGIFPQMSPANVHHQNGR